MQHFPLCTAHRQTPRATTDYHKARTGECGGRLLQRLQCTSVTAELLCRLSERRLVDQLVQRQRREEPFVGSQLSGLARLARVHRALQSAHDEALLHGDELGDPASGGWEGLQQGQVAEPVHLRPQVAAVYRGYLRGRGAGQSGTEGRGQGRAG